MRENSEDPPVPLSTIAEQIAGRAGMPLIRRGIVETAAIAFQASRLWH